MSNEFRLPDLGEGLRDATILQWYVAPGDRVVADQPLVALETDKAVIDVPAPASGRVASLGAAAGERIAVGAVLVRFAAAPRTDPGAVAGELPTASPAPAAASAKAPAAVAGGAHVRASPAARRLAHELRCELESITASGPGGVIGVADVERAVPARGADAVAWQELGGARRALALNMAAAREVPVASVQTRACVGAWHGQARPLPRLIRALVHACRVEPALNAWFDAARLARRVHATVDLGLAVDTPDGLLVPVLHDAAALDDAALIEAVRELRAGALAQRLRAQQTGAATITLSDFGAIGGETAQMIVLPPQVAIVGAGRIATAVVARDGAPAVEPVLPLSLSFDHRAVTGGEATRFLEALREHLEGT